jgi:transposase
VNKSAEQHLAKAREYVARGEEFYRKAAEEIVAAMQDDPTLSSRQIAELLGRSKTWVNDLVRWDTSGREADTPYGGHKQRNEKSATQRMLRDATPEQVAEILDTPEIRANVSKALDRHYRQRAETASVARRERQADDRGGEEVLVESEHVQRLAEIVNVLRGAVSGLRFAASQAKGLELERDETGAAQEMERLVEEIVGFGSMLRDYLAGQTITDEDIAQLIGVGDGTDES